MLELLRSRLVDLETRQRAVGGTVDSAFWKRDGEGMPSSSSAGSPASSTRPGRTPQAGGKTPRVAPVARPRPEPRGPWAGTPAGDLEPGDLDLPPLDRAGYEAMINDPAWIEETAALAEAHAEARAQRVSDDCGVDQMVAPRASAGLSLTRHHETDVLTVAEQVARGRMTHDVTLVTLVSELVARGTELPGGLTLIDWLRTLDPALTGGQARAFVTVATALTQPRWAQLRLLVATQQVTIANAAQVIDFDTRTRPVADPDDLSTALTDLTDQAPTLRPEELARLARHHTEQVRPPKDEDHLDRGRREARGLWFDPPTATGMVGLRGLLDPEGAAIIKAAIDPLSAPAPTTDEHGRTVEADDRSPARRRLEALLTVVQRGVAAADGVPTTDKAKVVVLIDLDTLTSDVPGSGTTLTGEVLSPGAVRRMACDAQIVPAVLGASSEPLDLGRTRRLFTRGQRLALTLRDRGCTYPGCTVPATWCDAHHLTHWARGGPTTLTNAALLCPRHHTHVHDHDLTATVTTTGVTWHT